MDMKELYNNMGGEIKEFEKFEGDLHKGYKFTYEKRLSEVDVQFFGLVSGDFNPVHFDEKIASGTRFGGRIVHGMLTTSLVSAALARLPGLVIILETYFRYTAPVRIGDVVKVEGVVKEADMAKKQYKIDITCSVEDKTVIQGWTNILIW
ncbi:MAG: acyl dehydratase [Deltaproteobacteria bacterium]|nr:MAG: acyl dehydratase [Deltaproteobacteria bacterium]